MEVELFELCRGWVHLKLSEEGKCLDDFHQLNSTTQNDQIEGEHAKNFGGQLSRDRHRRMWRRCWKKNNFFLKNFSFLKINFFENFVKMMFLKN